MRLCCKCGKPFDRASWQCPSCLYEPKRLGGHLAFAPELAEKSEGFDASSFGRLAELEPGSFWFRSRNRLLRLPFYNDLTEADQARVLSGLKEFRWERRQALN